MNYANLVPLLIAAALAVGCEDTSTSSGGSTAPKSEATAAPAAAALPTNLRLASAPAEAKGVAAVKTSAKDGDRVVLRGVVAGRSEPIAANRAIVTLLDAGIATCDKNPADGCRTP